MRHLRSSSVLWASLLPFPPLAPSRYTGLLLTVVFSACSTLSLYACAQMSPIGEVFPDHPVQQSTHTLNTLHSLHLTLPNVFFHCTHFHLPYCMFIYLLVVCTPSPTPIFMRTRTWSLYPIAVYLGHEAVPGMQ